MGGAPIVKRRSAPCLAVAALVATAACSGNIDGAGDGGGAGATTGGSGGASGAAGNAGKSGNGGSSGASGAAGSSGAGPTPNALGSKVRRLSRAELDNSVRDALGDTTNPASRYLSEDEFAPFDNDYTLQRASRALIDSLEAFADDVAARAVDTTNRTRNVPCAPASDGDTACFTQAVESLGRRLFRRTLTTAEVTP
jgi:hypothetical protein